MVSMSGPWTSYLRFSTQRWLFNKVDILCLADQWNMRAKVMILWSKSPVTRNVIWKQATPRHCSTEKRPQNCLLGPRCRHQSLFNCYKEELCSRLYMTTILVLHLKDNLMDRVLNSWVEVTSPIFWAFLTLQVVPLWRSEVSPASNIAKQYLFEPQMIYLW